MVFKGSPNRPLTTEELLSLYLNNGEDCSSKAELKVDQSPAQNISRYPNNSDSIFDSSSSSVQQNCKDSRKFCEFKISIIIITI